MVTTRKPDLAAKFDHDAPDYHERYADLDAVTRRQVGLVRDWVEPVAPGARVLELGCANGFVTTRLAQAGFDVIGVDLSVAMLHEARRRLRRDGHDAKLLVGDVDRLPLAPSARVDAVLGLLGTFFHYADDPAVALRQLAALQPRKLVVDMNTRTLPLSEARAVLRATGFRSFAWRPFLMSHRVRLPRAAYSFVTFAECTPAIRSALHAAAQPNIVLCATDLTVP